VRWSQKYGSFYITSNFLQEYEARLSYYGLLISDPYDLPNGVKAIDTENASIFIESDGSIHN
jgi:hypothetical protein